MAERIQKLLAARGVGSRRQVEAWIAAGRISVNGRPATAGQPVTEQDDVRLDGRRLRLRERPQRSVAAQAYHRPPGEPVRGTGATERSSLERLPGAAGRRWVPVRPLPVGDGGLELFVADGALAAALTRRGAGLPCDYSVRIHGEVGEEALARLTAAAVTLPQARGTLDAVEPAGGERSNRWLQLRCHGLRPHDLRSLFEQTGLAANRILRTRLGPVVMERRLARGMSRPLTEAELAALREAAGVTGSPARRPRPTGHDRARRRG
ncbi:MAG: 23S rRNA pseudouridylate synthase B [Gammaproteobacteria bacterium]|nr:23S rRNA pseudouridylate synthase B [Gammaproteobacteria bacterium]